MSVAMIAGSPASLRGARAFTLIELLLVLGLLAAILALALPLTYRSLTQRAFKTAQSSVVGALLEARAHAQREGVMVEMVVDTTGTRLQARELPVDGAEPRRIEDLGLVLEAPIRLFVGDGGGTIALFLPDGSAPISRSALLRDEGPIEALVTISAQLGRAEAIERFREDPEREETEEILQ